MSARPIVAALSDIPACGLDRLIGAGFDVRSWKSPDILSGQPLNKFVEGAVAIVPTVDNQITTEVMDAAGPQLRVIACYSVGHNNVNKKVAGKRGIRVTNTPDLLTDATADLTMAVMMALLRNIVPAAKFVKDGKWKCWLPLGFRGIELRGKSVGIIGFGRIGRAVAERLLGFGVRIYFYDPHFDENSMPPELADKALSVPLKTLLKISDIITLHCDLSEDTEGMVNWDAFCQMGKHPYLINCARGGLVSTTALVGALSAGLVSGAGLDVTDPEPLPANHPLLEFKNVLVVPHIGSATYEARDGMSYMVADSIISCVNSNELPTNCVNASLLVAI